MGQHPFRNDLGPGTGQAMRTQTTSTIRPTGGRSNFSHYSILHQGIHTAATRRSKLGVKTQKLSIVVGCEMVNHVGTPLASRTRNTEGLTHQSSLSINLLKRSAFLLSDLGIHCASRASLCETNIKSGDGSWSYQWRLYSCGTPIGCGTLIVGELL